MLWSKALGTQDQLLEPYRGVFGGGFVAEAGSSTRMDYINIATFGDSTFFGNLSSVREDMGGVSNGSRGVFGYGSALTPYAPSPGSFTITYPTNMNYITIATASNATGFGTVTSPRYGIGTVSSSTRGVFAGGYNAGSYPSPPASSFSSMNYITIATTGNTSTFGNLTASRAFSGGVSDKTRGVFGGGYNQVSATLYSTMDYITIATTGNATSFGILTASRSTVSGVSDGSRGVFGGSSFMDYIQISTTGNATTFGNFVAGGSSYGGVSSPMRGVFLKGSSSLEYITIPVAGNASSFGSLSGARSRVSGISEF